MSYSYLKTIKDILAFSPRQMEGETKTADYLIGILRNNQISHSVQGYSVLLPSYKKAWLKCDGREMACSPNGFVSGQIGDKDGITSSLIPSTIAGHVKGLNFNPYADTISMANFYNAPALAINRKDLGRVLAAKKIEGGLEVIKNKHLARNIIIGNMNTPMKTVCFAHYDSISTGAIDNASGVAVMLSSILKGQNGQKTLFVLSANEELSYDWPYYWGRGYREFEKKYSRILDQAQKILAIDCVGNGKTTMINDPAMIMRAIPFKNIKKYIKKVKIITGDYEHLMTVYHSEKDDGRGIKNRFLIEAENVLNNEIE